MRKSWTDDRLDDFAAHTDRRFDEVDRRFDEVDRRFDEVDRRFDTFERRVDEGFSRVDAELRAMNLRFDGLQRTLLQIAGGTIATLIAGFAGIIVTQL